MRLTLTTYSENALPSHLKVIASQSVESLDTSSGDGQGILNEDLNTFWESEAPEKPHTIQVIFTGSVRLSGFGMNVSFARDGNYVPSDIVVGPNLDDGDQAVARVPRHTGWVIVQFDEVISTKQFEIAVVANHNYGQNSRIRQLAFFRGRFPMPKLVELYGELSLNLGALLKDDCTSDVTVIVENRRFAAHKCILAARSDYFRGLFSGAFIESNQKETRIEGIAAADFDVLLHFLYTAAKDPVLKTIGYPFEPDIAPQPSAPPVHSPRHRSLYGRRNRDRENVGDIPPGHRSHLFSILAQGAGEMSPGHGPTRRRRSHSDNSVLFQGPGSPFASAERATDLETLVPPSLMRRAVDALETEGAAPKPKRPKHSKAPKEKEPASDKAKWLDGVWPPETKRTLQLFDVANRLMCRQLRVLCECVLADFVTLENCRPAVAWARDRGADWLKHACLKLMAASPSEVFQKGWLDDLPDDIVRDYAKVLSLI